jgi:hypothetical protein
MPTWSYLTKLATTNPLTFRIPISTEISTNPSTRQIQDRFKVHQLPHKVISPLPDERQVPTEGRFRFTINDNYEFKSSVIIDILYLKRKPVLRDIDAARLLKTCLQAMLETHFVHARSIPISNHRTRLCTMQRKNFTSTEFRQFALSTSIKVKEVTIAWRNWNGTIHHHYVTSNKIIYYLEEK